MRRRLIEPYHTRSKLWPTCSDNRPEVCDPLAYGCDRFRQNTSILNKKGAKALPSAYVPSTYAKPFKAPVQTHKARPQGGYIPAKPKEEHLEPNTPAPDPSRTGSTEKTGVRGISETYFYGGSKPKAEKIVIGEKSNKQRLGWGGALHNPNEVGAVVMDRPPESEAKKRSVVMWIPGMLR